MIGQTISHYKILEKLGEGGMGVVYKAQDTKLDRLVALKFLPPHMGMNDEEKIRFIHEAKAAAALNHPNIVTIYEINEFEGQTYIAMEYLEGESLKDTIASDTLSLPEAMDISIQIAQGLEEAHQNQVIHRDIKSANIVITGRGQVKILDFGLAKLKGQTKLTKEGTTLGTVAYMSPEQSLGDEVDIHTDIWSLGVLIYEMVAGQMPFRGDYEQAVIYSILNEDPEPLEELRTNVPEELDSIIRKTLAKHPQERYDSASDLLEDLKTVSKTVLEEDIESRLIHPPGRRKKTRTKRTVPGPGKVKKSFPKIPVYIGTSVFILVVILSFIFWPRQVEPTSIAVLPFNDMSPEKNQQHNCEGIAGEIIHKLTNLSSLRVIARATSFRFSDPKYSIKEIGKLLDCSLVISGSLKDFENRSIITVELINAADESQLWSRSYDRSEKDWYTIHNDIAMAVVDKLKIEVAEEEREAIFTHTKISEKAYDLYQKARYFWYSDKHKQAIAFFKQVIKEEPEYSDAYSGLASSILFGHQYWDPNTKKFDYSELENYNQKALALNPDNAEALATRARLKRERNFDWIGAEKDFLRALDLNPHNPTTLVLYTTSVLYPQGRFQEASYQTQKLLKISPYHGRFMTLPHYTKYLLGNYKEALKGLQNLSFLFPDNPLVLSALYRNLWAMGEYYQSIETWFRWIKRAKKPATRIDENSTREEIFQYVSELAKLNPRQFSLWLYASIGEVDIVVTSLRRILASGRVPHYMFLIDPLFKDLKNHPVMDEIRQAMKLPATSS